MHSQSQQIFTIGKRGDKEMTLRNCQVKCFLHYELKLADNGKDIN